VFLFGASFFGRFSPSKSQTNKYENVFGENKTALRNRLYGRRAYENNDAFRETDDKHAVREIRVGRARLRPVLTATPSPVGSFRNASIAVVFNYPFGVSFVTRHRRPELQKRARPVQRRPVGDNSSFLFQRSIRLRFS